MKKGFTLVELLVVVAIIGLLVSISIGATRNYREKARDARIKAVLGQVRSVASMIYDKNYSYEGLCSGGTLNSSEYPKTLAIIAQDVREINGGENVVCSATQEQYCVSSRLTYGSNKKYCVDFTGYTGEDLPLCDSAMCQP